MPTLHKPVHPPPPPVKPKIKEIIERWYLCIVMEHASRGDLLQVIDKHKMRGTQINESTIWALCSQVAHALHYLHSQHVVHRDIKPQNILLTAKKCFKIGDLGISRKLNSKTQLLMESKIGTPLYACPELIKK
jgi:serine/threonine protein kinase